MQKQPKILNYKNLNIEKYEYLHPHKTQNGFYQSICNYRLAKNQLLPFYFETPKLKTTSGIVRIDNNYYMDLELSQSGESGTFYDFLIKNDENNISVCHENAKEWFNQVMPLNIVENYYKTPILLKSNGKLPVIRIRLPSYKGSILTEIFNIRKEKINDISCIQEGDYIVGILEFTGLTFMSQNFFPSYELQKIKIFKDNDFRAIPSGYIFSDINDTVNLESKLPVDNILTQPIENVLNTENDNVMQKLNFKDLEKIVELENIKTVMIDNNTTNNTNISIQKTVETMSQPVETTIQKPEETIIQPTSEPIETIDTNDTALKQIITDKSLYDIIKSTTLKDIIMDDELFSNNKWITNNKHIMLSQSGINNVIGKIDKINNTINNTINNDETENQTSNETSNTENLTILIKDIDNIDLDIDYDLESPHSPLSPNDLSDNEDKQDDEEDIENDEKDENDEQYIENDDVENVDDEYDYETRELEGLKPSLEDFDNMMNEDDDYESRELEGLKPSLRDLEGLKPSIDDIDYDTLNELEVIVFDE